MIILYVTADLFLLVCNDHMTEVFKAPYCTEVFNFSLHFTFLSVCKTWCSSVGPIFVVYFRSVKS